MLIKPDLKDEEIVRCLRDAYGLTVDKVMFLTLGADFNTAVYCITTTNQTDYFLKLRSGKFLEASVSVPKHLADLGINHVIPPLATKTGQLWANLSAFKAILYPYVNGIMVWMLNHQMITGFNLGQQLKSFIAPIFLHQ
jgi:spectinomycin phosphotransferase